MARKRTEKYRDRVSKIGTVFSTSVANALKDARKKYPKQVPIEAILMYRGGKPVRVESGISSYSVLLKERERKHK